MFTETEIRELIDRRFSGKLLGGKHEANGQACALEAYSQLRGVEWTDSPSTLDMPDVRRINDALWSSDEARTAAMVPLLAALSVWPSWSKDQRVEWARRVAKRTISEILPIALRAAGLVEAADRCEREGSEESAREAKKSADDAADAAAYAAADAAAYAAYAAAAANAAAYAAADADAAAAAAANAAAYDAAYAAADDAAAYAAANAKTKRDEVLNLACRIWIETVPAAALTALVRQGRGKRVSRETATFSRK